MSSVFSAKWFLWVFVSSFHLSTRFLCWNILIFSLYVSWLLFTPCWRKGLCLTVLVSFSQRGMEGSLPSWLQTARRKPAREEHTFFLRFILSWLHSRAGETLILPMRVLDNKRITVTSFDCICDCMRLGQSPRNTIHNNYVLKLNWISYIFKLCWIFHQNVSIFS